MMKQFEKKQFKQIQTHSQSGRSMVEMLGVLAIIAILSIGGIVGYRLAMNHYQASQIAHEMNIMRTDAQIKIAQGTEKLTLGSPYDPLGESTLGHIQFNDAYPVDFACSLADDKDVILGVDCHVANAYYIELQNIPEGVCRPLAELLNGMSDVIAFNVNKNEYPDEGKCEAGNENILNAVFSAEAVSELKACKGVGDCEELENTPYCDPSRHVCVRCYEDSQCAHTEYCEDNTCVTCESGVWNGEECVECTADDDCTDPDTPKCNTDTNTCVECVESGDCEESLVCRENTCSLCNTEEECQAKGTDYHCSKEDKCIQCPSNLIVWGGKEKGCVECVTYENCKDTPDTPNCNTEINKCEACPKNSFWDGTKCAPGCKVNANCENGKYCHLGESSLAIEQTGVGSCQLFATELKYSKMLDGITYYGSQNSMTWFDACHLCAARANYADDTKCNKPLNWSPTNYMADYGIVKCTDKETNASATNLGWGGNRPYCIVSDRTKDLRELFGFEREKPVVVQIWMGNARSNAGAYDYRTNDAYLHDNSRNDPPNGGHALCH